MTRNCGQATVLRGYRVGVRRDTPSERRLRFEIFEALRAHYQTCIICNERDPT